MSKVWPAVAAIGVLVLTEPWRGSADPVGVAFALSAGVCWAAYILLTQKVGDEATGISGLAISMPVAGLVSLIVFGPGLAGDLTPEILVAGLGLALLVPVVSFALEMLALQRLTTSAFGTLMGLEPAIAVFIGLVVLSQRPGLLPSLGVLLVVAAGIGAGRTGAREFAPPSVADRHQTPRAPESLPLSCSPDALLLERLPRASDESRQVVGVALGRTGSRGCGRAHAGGARAEAMTLPPSTHPVLLTPKVGRIS